MFNGGLTLILWNYQIEQYVWLSELWHGGYAAIDRNLNWDAIIYSFQLIPDLYSACPHRQLHATWPFTKSDHTA